MEPKLYLGSRRLRVNRESVEGRQVALEGELFYQIAHYDRMRPFFMTTTRSAISATTNFKSRQTCWIAR